MDYPLLIQNSFVALDVETANANVSSICQIAAVSFASGQMVDVWHSFVNPKEPFASFNVSLHGIDVATVHDAPDFPRIQQMLSPLLTGRVVASHMSFDRIAIQQACNKYQIPAFECSWLDTARVARRAWPRFARRGYGLKSIASWCGFNFRHHDAVEDATTAGRVLARAVEETNISVEQWLNHFSSPDGNNSRRQNNHERVELNPGRSPLGYGAEVDALRMIGQTSRYGHSRGY